MAKYHHQNYKLDKEEEEILKDYEEGNFKVVKTDMQKYKDAAINTKSKI